MWKAERFEGTEQKDPLDEMLDFVNAHHLQPGQFQFSIAADEEGYQYCVMLYTEEKPVAVPLPPTSRQPARAPGGERSNRFGPPGGGPGERPARGGRPGFKPQFGPPEERLGGRGGRPGGGRPQGGGGPRRGGPPRGGGRPKRSGGGGGGRAH